ncbi:unnamed protein product [Prorocentrum cordatum]|uniref:Uncharacterized protein n=1 Tax=Prorocentrum cordatum TaxID=2364126 RepID=A0ABN9VTR9_9DINO|nr:unnamed protein product [Polarella glacialis]
MAPLRRLAAILSGAALAAGVTPVEKVLTLLDDLKANIEQEGTAESQEYDRFACFCKDATGGRSSSILERKDESDILSASIAEDTASKATKAQELAERKAKHEEMEAELAATKDQLAKDTAQYNYNAADLSKAISSLASAMTALRDAKTPPGAALLLALRSSVAKGSQLARALDSRLPKAQAFLQAKVDPTSPEYKYHSDGIISTIEDLHTEFTAKKTTLDADFTSAKEAAEAKIAALEGDLSNNDAAMSGLETAISTLSLNLAAHKEGMIMVEAILKDDKVYLKDLTERCEARAHDWDQRSQMRADELSAITEARAIIAGRVQGMDEAVNIRALVQSGQAAKRPAAKVAAVSPSFVQSSAVRAHDHQAAADAANATELSQAQRDSTVELLAKEGIRLKSQPISMLAMKLAGDPFAKVKDLIQGLIERLLKESIGEATKEGFCNEELGKAEKDRDFRYQEVKTLNVEVASLELKKDELESEIQELTDSIAGLWNDLNTSTTLRGEEHDLNMDTLAKSKSGLEAITEAIVILKAFYAKGAKAISLAQASPVDEDTAGPGFTGNYGGKQVASKGIIGMLAVVKTDFERTIKMTSDSEKKAQADFVEFDRVSRTDISGKTTKKTLDEEDLRTTVAAIAEGMSKLQTEMSLLDSALKRLFELKPMCTDFGMSYADRVAKREQEIDALKRAICALGGECS